MASDENYKDPTNLQAKIQKHQAFEAEVAAHSNAIVVLDNTGNFYHGLAFAGQWSSSR